MVLSTAFCRSLNVHTSAGARRGLCVAGTEGLWRLIRRRRFVVLLRVFNDSNGGILCVEGTGMVTRLRGKWK